MGEPVKTVLPSSKRRRSDPIAMVQLWADRLTGRGIPELGRAVAATGHDVRPSGEKATLKT